MPSLKVPRGYLLRLFTQWEYTSGPYHGTVCTPRYIVRGCISDIHPPIVTPGSRAIQVFIILPSHAIVLGPHGGLSAIQGTFKVPAYVTLTLHFFLLLLLRDQIGEINEYCHKTPALPCRDNISSKDVLYL